MAKLMRNELTSKVSVVTPVAEGGTRDWRIHKERGSLGGRGEKNVKKRKKGGGISQPVLPSGPTNQSSGRSVLTTCTRGTLGERGS